MFQDWITLYVYMNMYTYTTHTLYKHTKEPEEKVSKCSHRLPLGNVHVLFRPFLFSTFPSITNANNL